MKRIVTTCLVFFTLNISAQLDMISTNNNMHSGVLVGFDYAFVSKQPPFVYNNLRVDVAKAIDDFGFYLSLTPLVFKEEGWEVQHDSYAAARSYTPIQVGHPEFLISKTAFGLSWQPDNWIMVYSGIAIGTVKGRLETYHDDPRTPEEERFKGVEVIKGTTTKPEVGLQLIPFRFLSARIGYDASWETISWGISLGWYFGSERGRGYRRRR